MKTLHTAYRVRELDRSVAFYRKLGFQEVGRVSFADGSTLVMLNLPGDAGIVTLELVYEAGLDSLNIGNGFSHIVVQVELLDAKLAELATEDVDFDEPQRPAGAHGPKTS